MILWYVKERLEIFVPFCFVKSIYLPEVGCSNSSNIHVRDFSVEKINDQAKYKVSILIKLPEELIDNIRLLTDLIKSVKTGEEALNFIGDHPNGYEESWYVHILFDSCKHGQNRSTTYKEASFWD